MDGRAFSFGPFRLLVAQRHLLDGDRSVRLGSRAFDILLALVERAGKLVRKDELMGLVWPQISVDESNLQIQISTLRRALGDGQGGHRYIMTIPGQGYNFVALVTLDVPSPDRPASTIAAAGKHNLPLALTRMIGREAAVAALVSRLSRERQVTIVGPGGIGKTTVALAVAEHLIPDYRHGVWMIDLAPIGDARLVPSAVATVLGLEVRSENPIPALVAYLRDKRMLLLLDNCEHVIDAAAGLATAILSHAPGVAILATSRESLDIAGEVAHRIGPLSSPPPSPGLTAAEVAAFPAVQLFVERATATVEDFALTDTNAARIVEICQRLDGLPLAIEFAAPRVEALGVEGLAARLDDSLPLLARSRRTAAPRHRTMGAVLDWSYGLLSEEEQRFFRALGIFRGVLTVEAAAAVALGEPANNTGAITRLADLVAKSLVVVDVSATVARFRLLDTTRSYALGKLGEAGELQTLARRHAEYLRLVMRQAEAEWQTRPTSEWRDTYAPLLDDVRAAIDWAFFPAGDSASGVALTAAAAPLFWELWLLEECRARAERSLAVFVPVDAEDNRRRMQLYAAVAAPQAYTVTAARDARAAWAATLNLADGLGDIDYQLRALWGIWSNHLNRGEFREGLEVARRFSSLVETASDISDRPLGDRLIGASLHFLGDQRGAREYIERMLAAYMAPTRRSHVLRFQSEQRVTSSMYLARVLWLQGFAEQAMEIAETSVRDGLQTGHPQSVCNALHGAACPVALLTGNLTAAKRYTAMLLDQTEQEELEIWHAHAVCFDGELMIRRGDLTAGLQRMHAGAAQLIQWNFCQYIVAFLGPYAEGLAAAGQFPHARNVIDDAIARSERDDGRWCLAELLRIRAKIGLGMDGPGGVADAEETLGRSMDLARAQGALSWELRAATDLARLWRDRGRIGEARILLSGLHDRFEEGHGTADLRAANDLLQTL